MERCLTVVLLIALTVGSASLLHAASAAEKIKVAIPSRSMGYLPFFVAVQRGFFRDEGIDLELIMMRPSNSQAALIAGDVDYHGMAESGLRLAAKGTPIKAIFFSLKSPLYFLMAKPQIKTVPELRGKKLGISSFGGAGDNVTRLALRHFGVDPEREVLIIMIGLDGTRLAALTLGSIDATIANPPAHILLRQKGFNELLAVGDVVEFPANGFTTTERQIKERRDQLKRFLRAVSRGLVFAKEKPKETIDIMAREWQIEPSVAEDVYGPVSRALSNDGGATESGLKVHFQIIQKQEKGIGEITVSKVVDFGPLEEARRELGMK